MSLLQVKGLGKVYNTKLGMRQCVALKNISFEIIEGEFVAIMGASGSGKTTLLNILASLDKPTTGDVLLDGKSFLSIPDRELSEFRRKHLGFVFQDFNLLDTLTAFENIALALTIGGTPAGDVEPRVHQVAKQLMIEDILEKYPYQLSGGQKQRVASARAIVTKPALVLADEPTGALDSKSARMLLESFETLNRELQATILMVTHDAFTASYCSRILSIKDGRIFNEIDRGESTRKELFTKIIDVVSLLGGDSGNVL